MTWMMRRDVQSVASVVIALVFALPAGAARADGAAAVVKTDDSGFPAIRVYVKLGDPQPVKATAGVEFAPVVTQAQRAALEAAAKAIAERKGKEAAGEKVEGPPVPAPPSIPSRTVKARVLPFSQQTDSREAVTVILLIDTSASMKGSSDGIGQVRGHVKALLGVLRPIDRVALVTFDDGPRLVVPPTTEHVRVLAKVSALEPDGTKTKLYDALAHTLTGELNDRLRAAAPPATLPGRTFVYAFSDGLDSGSRIKSEDFRTTADRFKAKMTLFTVGVGAPSGGGAKDQYADLARIANMVGNPSNFFERPASSKLVERLQSKLAALSDTVLLEFDVPLLHRKQGKQVVELHYQAPGADEWTVDVEIAAQKVSAKDAAERKALLDEVAAVQKWADESHAAAVEKKAWTTWGAAGGAALLLLIILVAFVRRAARKKEDARRAQLQQIESQMQSQFQHLGQQGQQMQQEVQQRLADEAKRAAAMSRVALAELLAIDGTLRGKRFGILSANCVAGRDAENCNLVFPSEGGDLGISRTHARFTMSSNGWTVTCLSQGGLAVRGVRVNHGETYPLHPGDHVTLGKTVFEFRPG